MNNDLNSILKNSDPKSLFSKLSAEEKLLFESLMKDSSARAKFLSGDEAQKILKMLKKE